MTHRTLTGAYVPGPCMKPIGSLHPHSKWEGCWTGMMGETAILIHTGAREDGTPTLVLFENPAATELMNATQAEER